MLSRGFWPKIIVHYSATAWRSSKEISAFAHHPFWNYRPACHKIRPKWCKMQRFGHLWITMGGEMPIFVSCTLCSISTDNVIFQDVNPSHYSNYSWLIGTPVDCCVSHHQKFMLSTRWVFCFFVSSFQIPAHLYAELNHIWPITVWMTDGTLPEALSVHLCLSMCITLCDWHAHAQKCRPSQSLEVWKIRMSQLCSQLRIQKGSSRISEKLVMEALVLSTM